MPSRAPFSASMIMTPAGERERYAGGEEGAAEAASRARDGLRGDASDHGRTGLLPFDTSGPIKRATHIKLMNKLEKINNDLNMKRQHKTLSLLLYTYC